MKRHRNPGHIEEQTMTNGELEQMSRVNGENWMREMKVKIDAMSPEERQRLIEAVLANTNTRMFLRVYGK